MPQAPASPCPSTEKLSAFSLGKLTDAEVEAIGRHLAKCPSCTAAVQNVPADSFVGQLKAARRPTGATMLPPGATLGQFQSPASAAGPDVPPELQGHPKYRMVRALGEGGMGKVYLVEHLVMKTQVALKVVSQTLLASAEALDRFHREIQTAAQLVHPNIVRALDAEAAGGLHLLVMEYVEGWSLEKVVTEKGPMAVVQACRVAHQAAQGLQYAHGKGMIHRDIKPQNLMVTRQGQVKILDFGLAKMVREQAQGHGATQAGAFMGTPEYVAPEQAVDASKADIRADIYSLGCTLYYLLAGRPPYVEKTAVQVVLAHLEKEAVPLHQVRAEVSEELSAVVAKMMAKDPGERYQTPAEAAQALKPFGTGQEAVPKARSAGTMIPGDPKARGSLGRRRLPESQSWAGKCPRSSFLGSLVGLVGKVGKGVGQRKQKKKSKTGVGVVHPVGDWCRRRWAWLVAAGGAALVLLLGIILIRLSAGTQGTLVVEVNEPGAIVTVQDDKDQVEVTRKGDKEKITISLKPGGHSLKVEKEGFQLFTTEFTIEEREKVILQVRLERPPEPGQAKLPKPPPAEAPFDAAKAKEHQENWAKYLGIPAKYKNSIGMEFALIPPGSFLMGSPEGEEGRVDNEVQHRVTLTKGFYLGVHEVTKGQFAQFMKATGYRTQAESGGGAFVWTGSGFKLDPKANWMTAGFEQSDGHPVVCISWNDAVAFADWLSAQDWEGRRYRLPTGAEWEYACRAGTQTAYYSGKDLEALKKVGWCSYDGKQGSAGGTKPVGQFQTNSWGLYDMHGNAWEWCQDWYGDYFRGDQVDPEGPAQGSLRVIRGGGWRDGPPASRSAFRNRGKPGNRAYGVGCRLALVPSGGVKETSKVVSKPQASAEPARVFAPFDQAKAKEHQENWAKHLGTPLKYKNSMGMEFALIPPGSFLMGSPPEEEGRDGNEVQHRVTLTKGFYLGVHKVTRGQFAQFVKATGYRTQAEAEGGAIAWTGSGWKMDPKANWMTPGFEQTDDHPVVCLSWNDAVKLADWLSAQDPERRRYRLPTEAEWEYACRAGTETAYCSGNGLEALKKVGWCSYDGKEGSAGRTKPLGHFQANGWGLYDMHGNAWEWCQDCFGEYLRVGDRWDPEGPAQGSFRVLRGGSWSSVPGRCRSAVRIGSGPGSQNSDLGCRLALVPSGG